MIVTQRQRTQPTRAGEVWTMDFVADQFGNGGEVQDMTVIDIFTRQALAIEAGSRLRGEHVVEVLNRLACCTARRRQRSSTTAASSQVG